MILAALLFISRVAATTTVTRVTGDYVERGRPHILQDKAIPDYVTVLRIHGPFLFGSTDKLTDLTADIPDFGEVVALRLRNMTARRRHRACERSRTSPTRCRRRAGHCCCAAPCRSRRR